MTTRDGRRASADLRVELAANGQRDRRRHRVRRSRPARSSGWSANRAPARPPSRVALLGHAQARHAHRRRLGPHRRDGRARTARRGAAKRARKARLLRPAGPGLGPQPLAADRRPARGGHERARRAGRRPRAHRRSARRGRGSRRPASSCSATRTSSPAASSSASAWPSPSCCGPPLIVLDEPTTGLDVTTQAHVLATVRELCHEPPDGRGLRQPRPRRRRRAGPARARDVRRAHRRGGPDERALRRAGAPVHAQADRRDPRYREPPAARGDPRPGAAAGRPPRRVRLRATLRLRATGVHAEPPPPVAVGARHTRALHPRRRDRAVGDHGAAGAATRRRPPPPCSRSRTCDAFHGTRQVLHGVSLQLQDARVPCARRRVGLGEDHARAGDHRPPRAAVGRGAPRRHGSAHRRAERSKEMCRVIQYVFQSPTSSLNPRRTIGEILRHAVRALLRPAGTRGRARVAELLERVSLPRRAAAPLSRRAVGRRAPARLDRARTRGRARHPDLRRDHVRPRHFRAGRDRASCSRISSSRRTSRSSSSLTISRSCARSPTGWRSCTSGGSSSTAAPTLCWTIRAPPTHPS